MHLHLEIPVPSKIDIRPTPLLLHLPPEILSEIFLWYKDILDPYSAFSDGACDLYDHYRDPSDPFPEKNDISPALLLLGRLCYSLRAIAWSTPQLWTHISLTLSHIQSRRSTQVANLTSWLARSCELPLHIRLESSVMPHARWSTESQFPHDHAFAAIEVIASHRSRLEELSLALPYECFSRLFRTHNTKVMPMLKRLTLLPLRTSESAEYVEGFPHMSVFPEAVALAEVNLLNFPPRTLMRTLPWAQITRFRGHSMPLSHSLYVLQRSPQLETCTISWALGYPGLASPLLHERIHTLSLEGSTTALKYLTLPALVTLQIKTRRLFPAEQCIQLLQRSGLAAGLELGASKLRILDISANFIPATDLLECLDATPMLRELKVLNRDDSIHSLFSDLLVKRLTLEGGKLDLVPDLQRLEVHGCSCQFNIGALGKMLQSRWASSAPSKECGEACDRSKRKGPLEVFRLVASSSSPLSIWEDVMYSRRVWRIIEEGMVVSVAV
ncbi:hypothetical protein DXG03_006496 [Asterophora parasitica]|uniref:F-box domain-containing protein n=1 Tax=Asterophora parasitica TaxID=117018 RepID=A0A9P7GDP8_9AGAR|nr:hypothetical protein DXG03_006496 [Asterophora parasitica]